MPPPTAAAQELPPIVVQGATLAKPTTPKSAPKAAQPAPLPEPPSAPTPANKAKSTKKSAPPPATPSQPPVASPGAGSGQGNAVLDGTSAPAATANTSAAVGNGDALSTGIAADEVGTSVSIVTGAQLRAQQVRHAGDALRSLPGVSVSRTGGVGQLTDVRIRGAETNHTLVLIDGVRANDSSNGAFDFSDLSADDIERIEVLRGPQSGLYGAGALGGVINIITRGGKGPLTFQARAEGGSFGTSEVGGRVSAGNDGGFFSLGYQRRDTNGFNVAPDGGEEDGSRLSTFSLRAGINVTPGLAVDFSLRKSRNTGDYDDFFGNPGIFATAFDAPNKFVHDVLLASGGIRWELFGGAFVQSLRATHNATERRDRTPFTVGANDSQTDRFTYTATYRLDAPALAGSRHYFTGLLEHEREGFTPSSDFGFFGRADGIERRRSLDAGAFEYRGEFAQRLFVTGTVRHDDHDTFDDFTTWRATATLKLPEIGMRPHASVGTGVKLPTMFETFGSVPGQFRPNPDLQPEESLGWDVGIEFAFMGGKALVDVTYFNADLRNKIDGFAFDPGSGLFTAVNLPGTSTREGIEVAGRFAVMPGVTLGLAYTYTEAHRPDGTREIRRAPHAGRADVNYVFDGGRGTINVAAVYNGTADDFVFRQSDFQQFTFALDDYWLVNVAASYKVLPGVEVFGRIENLLDQDYQEVFGYETAGIAAYAGVRLTFEEPATLAWGQR